MLRRSVLALIAVTAALPATITRAFAEGGDAPRKLTDEEIALINAVSAHNSAITTMVGKFLQVDTQGQRIEGLVNSVDQRPVDGVQALRPIQGDTGDVVFEGFQFHCRHTPNRMRRCFLPARHTVDSSQHRWRNHGTNRR